MFGFYSPTWNICFGLFNKTHLTSFADKSFINFLLFSIYFINNLPLYTKSRFSLDFNSFSWVTCITVYVSSLSKDKINVSLISFTGHFPCRLPVLYLSREGMSLSLFLSEESTILSPHLLCVITQVTSSVVFPKLFMTSFDTELEFGVLHCAEFCVLYCL